MPSAIIAKGYSGGGSFQNTRIRCVKINEFLGYSVPNIPGGGSSSSTTSNTSIAVTVSSQTISASPVTSIQTSINKFNGITVLPTNADLVSNYSQFFTPPPVPKIVYWEDEKSRTLDQLSNAVMRKMSEFQRAGFRLHYEVEDHAQNGIVWTKNTIATVYDEELGILSKPFWIIGVHYKKSRHGGTTTELTMIPVGTLILGPKGSKGSTTSSKGPPPNP